MSLRQEKLKRRQHRKDKKRRRANGLRGQFTRPEGTIIADPPGATKMSDVLMALIRPEWDLCEDEEAMRKLLTLGAAAWNAALMTGATRMAFLEDLAQKLPVEARQDFSEIFEPLIRRKEQLFPHIQRPILSFELTMLPSGQHYLSVLSGLT